MDSPIKLPTVESILKDELRKAVAEGDVSANGARAVLAVSLILLEKSADRLAAACLRAIDNGSIDARSQIGDALLDYAGVRTDSHGNEIEALRKILQKG